MGGVSVRCGFVVLMLGMDMVCSRFGVAWMSLLVGESRQGVGCILEFLVCLSNSKRNAIFAKQQIPGFRYFLLVRLYFSGSDDLANETALFALCSSLVFD